MKRAMTSVAVLAMAARTVERMPRRPPDTAGHCANTARRRSASLLRGADAQRRLPIPAPRDIWGLEQWEQANEQFRLATQPVNSNRSLQGALGHAAARAIQRRRRRGPLSAKRCRKIRRTRRRISGSRSVARRLRRQGHRVCQPRPSSSIRSSPRRMNCWPILRWRTRIREHGRRRGRQGNRDCRSDALDAMAIHAAIELLADRSPDAWFDEDQAVNPTYGEGYALVAHQLELHYRYRGRGHVLPQGDRGRSAAVVRAFGARDRADAAGSGRGALTRNWS